MAQLSRYEKYRDLRARLQSDTGSNAYESPDLADFANRLNRIDADNFSVPDHFSADHYSAAHARNTSEASASKPLRRTQSARINPQPQPQPAVRPLDQEDTFGTDYLDRYINEVKKYNIEQGNAASENTQINILRSLEQEQKKPAPARPFPRSESKPSCSDLPSSADEDTLNTGSLQQTADDYRSPAMTREDIMAEVQNLVNGSRTMDDTPSMPADTSRKMSDDTFNRHLEAERNTRQQLLNETAQMRAQLDDYEDNLSEVTNKMRQTNRILNIVLVILIIALMVILGVVIYWIMTSK